MKHTLSVFDGFTPDFLKIRQQALDAGFGTQTGPDGLEYTGICPLEAPELIEGIEKAIAHKIVPKLSCFRLNLAGEKPHSWIHSDDICAQYASVLYMNLPKQCQGGTAFWRHKGIGVDSMPTEEDVQSCGFDTKWFCNMMQKEWNDLTWWEQSGFVGMKSNRLLVYPTSMFHSRYPFEPFGSTPEDGRLIWVCFFDIAPVTGLTNQVETI